jgi:DNA replication protein DnaC
VSPGHPDFGKLFPCRCRLTEIEEQRREQLRILSNLDHLARMTFETFVTNRPGMSLEKASNLQSALDLARKYAGDPQGWLIFLGGYGCGKTHLAAAIANHALQRGRTVLFVVVPDLLDYLRATYAPTSPVSYDERFEQVRNAPLLILDDLGTQSSTAWAQEKLFQLLNYRYNARLPTVITSNQRLEEIDLRLRSRMVDPDLGIICPILAPDFRQGGVDKDHSELSSLPLMQDMTFEKFDLRQDELRDPTDRFTLKEAFSLCRNYAKEPVGWLVLAGPHGCGKTHLAAAIANARVSMGTSALFVVVPDLLDHLRATFSPTSQIRFDRRFEEVKTAPLLVLDDLGTESASPWAQEKLYQLLNHRYNARLPTVITMAQPMEQVEPRLRTRMQDTRRVTFHVISAPGYWDVDRSHTKSRGNRHSSRSQGQGRAL